MPPRRRRSRPHWRPGPPGPPHRTRGRETLRPGRRAHPSPPPPVAAAAPWWPDERGPLPPGGRPVRSLLVVDDDDFARNALAQILRAEGYDVACPATGREARRHLRRGALPDLILLALVMPVLAGFAFCRLQERDARLAGIPVLVVSAQDVSLPAPGAAPQVV